MDHNVVVSDYAAMDRVLKEERAYILNIVKQIKKAGCNVLLIQKSILRDAVSDLALHFLDKIKVLVVKDIEREDIEFVSKVKGFSIVWREIYYRLFIFQQFKVFIQSVRSKKLSCVKIKIVQPKVALNLGETILQGVKNYFMRYL